MRYPFLHRPLGYEAPRNTWRGNERLSRHGSEGAVAVLKRELEKGETTARIAEIQAFAADVTVQRGKL